MDSLDKIYVHRTMHSMLSSGMHKQLTQRQSLVGARLHTTVKTSKHEHVHVHVQTPHSRACLLTQPHSTTPALPAPPCTRTICTRADKRREAKTRVHSSNTHPPTRTHARTHRRGRYLCDSQSLPIQGGCAFVRQRKMISSQVKWPSALATSWWTVTSPPPRWVPLLVKRGC